MKYVVFMSLWPGIIKILISSWPRTRKFSQLFENRGSEDLFLPWSRSTFNFYAVIGQNLSGEFMQKIYAASWNFLTSTNYALTAEADRVLCQLVMFLIVFFPWIDVQNEIQLLSRVFCYSWLVCLLDFWLRNASLVKVGNPISDGIVFVFHLAWCVRGLQSLKRYWPYLIPFRSCISNGKPE